MARKRLGVGEVGYVIANIKTTSEVQIGETITDARQPASKPLPGFQQVHPMVFSGLYPIDSADFEHLKAALGKLQLNDSAFQYQSESSAALGFGFRCGFLGLLHMEIVQERLRRQFNMDIIATYPSVIYQVLKTDGGGRRGGQSGLSARPVAGRSHRGAVRAAPSSFVRTETSATCSNWSWTSAARSRRPIRSTPGA